MLTVCIACISFGVIPATALDIVIASNEARLDEADARRLASYRLTVPVAGITKRDLRDTYNEQRGGHAHEALDIPARRGAQVVAAGDGRIVKLFNSVAGGLTVYQFDPSERFAYYYAHLDRYEQNLAEGMVLKRGDAIGAVGTTGNAREDSPHLHFAIFKLGPEKQWWKGSPINPFPLLN
jgi:murein DD-endopeptidase MepM/ murein hydrolase activator NlpD